jgi:hypothetical protein
MAITYKAMEMFPNIQVPVLHKVYYSTSTDGVDAKYQTSLLDHQVNEWLRDNCRADYYRSTYHQHKFIQFEDDEDAIMFALKWT